MSDIINNYPKQDGPTLRYMHKPVEKNGKWRAGEIIEANQTLDPFKKPIKLEFDTEKECQRRCDVYNSFYFSEEEQEEILNWSRTSAP